MCVFETLTATGREHFACQDSDVSQILYQSTLMEMRYLAMQMRLGEDKLKGKTVHFRLPCASQNARTKLPIPADFYRKLLCIMG